VNTAALKLLFVVASVKGDDRLMVCVDGTVESDQKCVADERPIEYSVIEKVADALPSSVS
jgi:hypothetical protein